MKSNTKLHPHLAKYVHDIVESEATSLGESSKWKEELLRKILHDVMSGLSQVKTQEDLFEIVEANRRQLQTEIDQVLALACSTARQIPTEVLKRYSRP